MKLTYRGQSYEIATPVQFGGDFTAQSKIKLSYRGHSYDATPRLPNKNTVTSTAGSIVTLIYRGIAYQRILKDIKLYQSNRAINWRYQTLKQG